MNATPSTGASRPIFDRVVLKGGGDAVSASRAVLELGEADYAWNVQVDPETLAEMEAAGWGQSDLRLRQPGGTHRHQSD